MNQTEAVERLKQLNRKISQEQMAREIGVSVSTVNRWLKGHFKPIKYLLPNIERFIEAKK